MLKLSLLTFSIWVLSTNVFAQLTEITGKIEIPLKSDEQLTLINLELRSVEHENKQGIRLSLMGKIHESRR